MMVVAGDGATAATAAAAAETVTVRTAVAAATAAPVSTSRRTMRMRRKREVEEEERHRPRSPVRDEHKVSSGDGPRARHVGSRAGQRDSRRLGVAGRGTREPTRQGGRIFAGLLGGGCRRARGPTCCGHAARVQRAPVARRDGSIPSFVRRQRGRLRCRGAWPSLLVREGEGECRPAASR